MIKYFRQTINLNSSSFSHNKPRDDLSGLAEKVHEIGGTFEELNAKVIKITELQKSCTNKGRTFGETLENVGEKATCWGGNKLELSMAFLKLGSLFRQVEMLNEELNENMSKSIGKCIKLIVSKEIPSAKSHIKRYEKAKAYVESCESKKKQLEKSRDENNPKLFEAEQELNSGKEALEALKLEVWDELFAFNEQLDFRTIEYVVEYIRSVQQFFDKGLALLNNNVMPFLENLEVHSKKKKIEYNAWMEQRKKSALTSPESTDKVGHETIATDGSEDSIGENDGSSSEEEYKVVGTERVKIKRIVGDDKSLENVPIIKEGWLYKKILNKKKWKPYYFVLRYKYLHWYMDSQKTQPKGGIQLANCCVEPILTDEKYFSINCSDETFYFGVKGAKSSQEWVLAMKICLENEQPHPPTASEEELFSEWLASKKKKSSSQENIKKKKKLLQKLVTSELSCMNTLTNLLQLQQTLSSDQKVTSKKIFNENMIFCNMKLLHNLHKELLVQLQNFDTDEHYDEVEIGNMFLSMTANFCLYAEYVRNLSLAKFNLENCKKNIKAFPNYLKTFEQENGVDFEYSLFTLHVRVYQYEIFLKKMVEKTSEDEHSYSVLSEAYDSLRNIVAFIEQSQDRSTYTAQLLEIKQKLVGCPEDICAVPRRLVREGPLHMKSTSSVKPAPKYFFLFDDFVMETKDSQTLEKMMGGEKYKYRSKIELRKAMLKDSPEGEGKLSFSVSVGKETYIFSASSEEEKDNWVKDFTKVIKALNSKKVFGVDLHTLMASESEKGRDIPWVVEKCCEFVEKRALKTEGILRLSGNHEDIENLREQIDQGQEPDLESHELAVKEVHTVAGLLKLWFRSLPEPIIPFSDYDTFTFSISPVLSDEQRSEYLRSEVEKFPEYNKYLLQHISKFLMNIASQSQVNKMTPKNIAIVFGPSLMSKQKDGNEMTNPSQFNDVYTLTQCFIQHYHSIFGDIEIQREKDKTKKKDSVSMRRKTNMGMDSPVALDINREQRMSSFNSGSTVKQITNLPGEIVKQGWLSKKFLDASRWTTRWFVLKYKTLLCYASPKDTKPKERIELLSHSIVEVYGKKPFSFSVTIGEVTHCFCGKNQQEADEWLAAIKANLEKA